VSCADGEASSDPDPPTPSVTSTESEAPTGPVEPELPAAARKPTRAGAIAFVKHYWAMVHYAQSTGELNGLAGLSSENCQMCGGGVEALRELFAEGGVLKGPPSRVTTTRSSLTRRGPAGHKVLAAHVQHKLIAPRSVAYYGKGDKRNRTFKGGEDQEYFLLVWQEDTSRWLITDWSTA